VFSTFPLYVPHYLLSYSLIYLEASNQHNFVKYVGPFSYLYIACALILCGPIQRMLGLLVGGEKTRIRQYLIKKDAGKN
jgi:hypothetical protein